LKDVLEVRPCRVRGATAYSIKVAVRLEINPNRSNQGGRHVRTGRPARLSAATRDIDHTSHAKKTVCKADVGITTSRVKRVLINSAGVGKSSWKTIHVVRRTKLRIREALRTTANAMAATGPGPSHRVTDRDVDSVRRKRETRPHHDVDNLAGSRWHAIDSRPTVLIDNAQGCAPCVLRIWSLLAGFSPD
jgi:hypothetical protein